MSKRGDYLYVRDIRESIEAIFCYTNDISFEVFSQLRLSEFG